MLVLGDAHADEPERRESLLSAYGAYDAYDAADAALQTGDLGYYELPLPTWFIAGNNEEFDTIESLRRGDETDNVHLLASDVAELEGLRVAGISGNYAPTQYEKSRDELEGDRRRHFTHEDVEAAKSLSDVDVLLVHEAPHGLLRKRGYDVGCGRIDELLGAVAPSLCLVGHHHRHAESAIGGVRVVSLEPVWESYYTLDTETLELERHVTP